MTAVAPLTLRKSTSQCSVDGSKEVVVAVHEKGKTTVVQRRLEVLWAVVGHNRAGEELGGLAAGAKREVAYFDSQVFHALSMMYSDVSNVLVLPSVVHLAHSLAAGYNMADRKVVADVLGRKAQQQEEEDVRKVEMALGSRKAGKGFAHMVKQYSARRDAAVVVLDP